jgi:hypothetical protein
MPQTGSLPSPITLPRGTWKDTLKRTAAESKRDELNHRGAALTYYAVLSLFPALLVLGSLVGLFADPERVTKALTDVADAEQDLKLEEREPAHAARHLTRSPSAARLGTSTRPTTAARRSRLVQPGRHRVILEPEDPE